MILFPFYSIIIAWSIIFTSSYRKIKILFLILIFLFFSYSILNFFNNLNINLEKKIEDPCNKNILPAMDYLKKSNPPTMFVDTFYFGGYVKFYFPNKKIFYGIHDKFSNISFDDALKSALSEQDVLYAFSNKDCLLTMHKGIKIFENFISFMTSNNKTITLVKAIQYNGENIFEFYKVT
jgi:hypothetical protein